MWRLDHKSSELASLPALFFLWEGFLALPILATWMALWFHRCCSESGHTFQVGTHSENSRTNISHNSDALLLFLSLLFTLYIFISHVTCWLTQSLWDTNTFRLFLHERFSREFYLNWKSETLKVGHGPGGRLRPPPTYAEGDHFLKHPDRMFELKRGGLPHLILYLTHSSILPRMDLDFVKNHNYSTSILTNPSL